MQIQPAEIEIAVPWGHIRGLWYGDKNVRPLLTLHGWLDNCGSFARLAPLLLNHASLLCLDLPGHGRSSHLPVGMSYNTLEFVRVILRVMQAYEWDKVSLLGHSMGGSVNFYFAAIYPDKVDMLISIDIIKRTYAKPELEMKVIRYCIEKNEIENERKIQNTHMQEPPSYSFEVCERMLYEASAQSVDLENCKYILERNISKSIKYPDKFYFSRDGRSKNLPELNANPDMTRLMCQRICQTNVPYLVVRGAATKNPSGIAMVGAEHLKQNPNFFIENVPQGTHHVHLNNPAAVANFIKPFLEKYRPIDVIRNEKKTRAKL